MLSYLSESLLKGKTYMYCTLLISSDRNKLTYLFTQNDDCIYQHTFLSEKNTLFEYRNKVYILKAIIILVPLFIYKR